MKVVWNSSRKGSNSTIGEDELTVETVPSLLDNMVISNVRRNSGIHYCEIDVLLNKTSTIGVYKEPVDVSAGYSQATTWSYYGYGGQKYNNGGYTNYASAYDVGDTIGILLDLENMKVGFYKNGVYQGDAFTDLPKGEYGIMVANASSIYPIKLKACFNKDRFKYPIPENTTPFEMFSAYLIECDNKFYNLKDNTYDTQSSMYTPCEKDFELNGFEDISCLTQYTNINNETFKPIDKFKKPFKVLKCNEK